MQRKTYFTRRRMKRFVKQYEAGKRNQKTEAAWLAKSIWDLDHAPYNTHREMRREWARSTYHCFTDKIRIRKSEDFMSYILIANGCDMFGDPGIYTKVIPSARPLYCADIAELLYWQPWVKE